MDRRPFTFRLERIRALRERAEDSAKEEFAASLTHRLRGEAMLRAADERLDSARSAARTTASGSVSGADLIAAQSYVERIERARRAAAEDLSRRDADLEERRLLLIERSRERQALEKLKERRRADHQREASRIESGALDEMALTIHRRREVTP